MKRIRSVSLLFVLVFALFTGVLSEATPVQASSYYLATSYKTMYQGQTYTNYVCNTSSKVTWSSSNSDIAYVNSNGTITAYNSGIAVITATVNGISLRMRVEVVSKTAWNAVMYAYSAVGCRYSQYRRMSSGYYDCGSLVWRAYANSGLYIGGRSSWAPTAAETGSTLARYYTVVAYYGTSSYNMLPGDLVFSSSYYNGRYRGITHAAMYVGNGYTIEAANSRVGVVKRAYNSRGVVLVARPSKAPVQLRTPEIKSAQVSSSSASSVDIKWNTISNASGYYVYRKSEGGSYSKIATVSGSYNTSYTDTTAYAGTYYYTVKAFNSSKESGSAEAVKVTTKIAQATSFRAVYKNGTIEITWKNSSNVDGYVIYKENANGTYTKLGTVDASENEFTHTNVKAGKSYEYSIRAYKTLSSGSRSYSAKSYTQVKTAAVTSSFVR